MGSSFRTDCFIPRAGIAVAPNAIATFSLSPDFLESGVDVSNCLGYPQAIDAHEGQSDRGYGGPVL
jgi:hypothetical protein